MVFIYKQTMQYMWPAANILHTTSNKSKGSRKSTFLRITGGLAHEKIQNYAYVSDLETILSTKFNSSLCKRMRNIGFLLIWKQSNGKKTVACTFSSSTSVEIEDC